MKKRKYNAKYRYKKKCKRCGRFFLINHPLQEICEDCKKWDSRKRLIKLKKKEKKKNDNMGFNNILLDNYVGNMDYLHRRGLIRMLAKITKCEDSTEYGIWDVSFKCRLTKKEFQELLSKSSINKYIEIQILEAK